MTWFKRDKEIKWFDASKPNSFSHLSLERVLEPRRPKPPIRQQPKGNLNDWEQST